MDFSKIDFINHLFPLQKYIDKVNPKISFTVSIQDDYGNPLEGSEAVFDGIFSGKNINEVIQNHLIIEKAKKLQLQDIGKYLLAYNNVLYGKRGEILNLKSLLEENLALYNNYEIIHIYFGNNYKYLSVTITYINIDSGNVNTKYVYTNIKLSELDPMLELVTKINSSIIKSRDKRESKRLKEEKQKLESLLQKHRPDLLDSLKKDPSWVEQH